jgi:glycosyltransferase involved in cell wall biosynthesis
MKKILFVIDSLTCGGAEKSLVSLLPLLSRKKYEISLWMLSPIGPFISLVPKDIHIIEQPSYTRIEQLKLRMGRLFFSLLIRVMKLLKIKEHGAETLWKCIGWAYKIPKGEWDAIFAYQQGFPTYLVAEKFKSTKKFAWVNADIFAAGYNTQFNTRFYHKFTRIVPVSSILKDLMVEKLPEFKDKYSVVYDILNPNVIRELSLEPVTTLHTEDDESVFVTVGRLVPPKGYDIAIQAASVLKQHGIKFHWYFVGEGPERTNIERWKKDFGVDEEVVLLGLQTNPYAYMAQADVYVQTSKFEGFGLTIGEAKILGKPIVSTNFDVVHNQLTHEQNGLIADMNGESVAENILRLLEDKELKETILSTVQKEENTTYLSEAVKVEQLIDCNYED